MTVDENACEQVTFRNRLTFIDLKLLLNLRHTAFWGATAPPASLMTPRGSS